MTVKRAAAALLHVVAAIASGSEAASTGDAWLEGAKSVVAFLLPVPPEFLATQLAAQQARHPSLISKQAVRGVYPWNKRDQSPYWYDPHDPNGIANNIPGVNRMIEDPGLPDSQAKSDASPVVPQYHHPDERAQPKQVELLHAAWKELLLWVCLSGLFGYLYMNSREKHVEELFRSSGYPELQEEDFRTWRHAWYDCFAHTDITVMAFICPCVRWAETMSYVRPFLDWYLFWMVYVACWLLARLGWFSFYGWILGSLICTYFRQQLRSAYKMEKGGTTVVSDCALYCLCGPCAIAQEAKHVESSMPHHHYAVYPRPGFAKYDKQQYETFAPPQQFPAPLAEDPRPPSRSPVRTPPVSTQFYTQDPRPPSRSPVRTPPVSTQFYTQDVRPPSHGPSGPPSRGDSRGPSLGASSRLEHPQSGMLMPSLPMSAPGAAPESTMPATFLQQPMVMQQYEVTVPPGVLAGEPLRYPAEIGNQQVEVQCYVPAGMQPGMSFKHCPTPADIRRPGQP